MILFDSIRLLPILHGKHLFTHQLRELCLKEHFDCIAIDIPEIFQQDLYAAVEKLPIINAVIARNSEDDQAFYIPTDPCDATIEGIRQGFQNHIPVVCVGFPILSAPNPLPPLPDEYAAIKCGFDAYNSLCLQTIGNPDAGSSEDIAGQYIANRILSLRLNYSKILVILHMRHILRTVAHLTKEVTHNLSSPKPVFYDMNTSIINPDHLYFALGELPFVAGKFEMERYDPFADQFDIIETIKDLFRETRDNYSEEQDEITLLSPVRIQAALTFLRNLTLMSGQFVPSLLDIIESAKGVGGNSYAVRILKSAKYYPFLSFDSNEYAHIGIDRISFPGCEKSCKAINLFRDFDIQWRTISIKPDPALELKKKYKFSWNPYDMCSHIPEDQRIEHFNTHIRSKAIRVLTEDYVKSEKFNTSVKDGIDIRETLRNWHTGNIYVKEIPPSRGKVDTVVIIFDDNNDSKYPHYATWYAEHKDESTLSFYATDPFENMIGPGIARCNYGGLALLFPPRNIPNIFEITENLSLPNLATRLTYGAMLFSGEKNVAYVSIKKPSTELKKIAQSLKKHLIWLPISTFSNETLRKLRRFHILNGKTVRSWAGRFIGD